MLCRTFILLNMYFIFFIDNQTTLRINIQNIIIFYKLPNETVFIEIVV